MNQKCSHVSSGGSILATWLWVLNAQWFQKMFSNLVCQSALMKGDSPMVGWAICLVCKLKHMQIKDEKKSIWIWFVKNAFAWKLQCCERSDAHLQSLSIYSFPHNKWLSRNWGGGGVVVGRFQWQNVTEKGPPEGQLPSFDPLSLTSSHFITAIMVFRPRCFMSPEPCGASSSQK